MIRLIFSALGLMCGVSLLASEAHAGAGMPRVVATLSANGSILVVNELTFDDPDETHGRVPVTSNFRVFGRYIDLNDTSSFSAPISSAVPSLSIVGAIIPANLSAAQVLIMACSCVRYLSLNFGPLSEFQASSLTPRRNGLRAEHSRSPLIIARLFTRHSRSALPEGR